jgi:hypothetical protein
MMYMIRHKITGNYSKGGAPCPIWTSKIDDAKVWKKKAHLKSHLTTIKKYLEYTRQWGFIGEYHGIPDDWIVIEVEIVPRNTYEASTFS